MLEKLPLCDRLLETNSLAIPVRNITTTKKKNRLAPVAHTQAQPVSQCETFPPAPLSTECMHGGRDEQCTTPPIRSLMMIKTSPPHSDAPFELTWGVEHRLLSVLSRPWKRIESWRSSIWWLSDSSRIFLETSNQSNILPCVSILLLHNDVILGFMFIQGLYKIGTGGTCSRDRLHASQPTFCFWHCCFWNNRPHDRFLPTAFLAHRYLAHCIVFNSVLKRFRSRCHRAVPVPRRLSSWNFLRGIPTLKW